MLDSSKVLTDYHIKIKLAALVSVPLFTLLWQYGPPETAIFCLLMAVASW